MAKPIIPTTYLLDGNRVEVMPCFVYEVDVYKISKNMASLIYSKLYKSDKLLTIKKEVLLKKYKDYKLVRHVDILGVPKEFIEENELPIFEIKLKKKRKK